MTNAWLEDDIVNLVTKNGEIPVHKRLESHSGLRDAVSRMCKCNTLKEVHTNRDYRYYALSERR